MTTSGTNAVGVLAQSIGGGGGVAVSDGQSTNWSGPRPGLDGRVCDGECERADQHDGGWRLWA